jgi:hypothetical protein
MFSYLQHDQPTKAVRYKEQRPELVLLLKSAVLIPLHFCPDLSLHPKGQQQPLCHCRRLLPHRPLAEPL